MIHYKITPFNNGQKTVYSLIVKQPLEDLSIVGGLHEDLDHFIEWLEDLIKRDIPDFSEPGVIIYQGILWGSNKSKIIDFESDPPNKEKEEFYTRDLLQLCKEWEAFLVSKS